MTIKDLKEKLELLDSEAEIKVIEDEYGTEFNISFVGYSAMEDKYVIDVKKSEE